MLILCSGPDTYHARKKARELVAAFRQKHDPSGYSTEIMQTPELQDLLGRLGAPSLFAAKRLIRCDGLVESLKIAEVRQLAKRLESAGDDTIILSVEDEPPTPKTLKEFEKIKLVHYPAPLLSGAKFAAAVASRAAELGVSDRLAQEIAGRADGDTWLAEHELEKASANPNTQFVQRVEGVGTVFDAADTFLQQRQGWRALVAGFPDESMVSILATQTRTFSRVRDGETIGVHPYVAKKLSSMRVSDEDARRRFINALRSLYAARQFATDDEGQTLL